MVRKLVNSILILVLLLTTTGITYHYHYCGNTLMAFSVMHTPKPCCEHPEDCCRDRSTHFQLKNDFLFSFDFPDLSISGIELPVILGDIEENLPDIVVLQPFPEESPPPTVSMRLARLQQYLI